MDRTFGVSAFTASATSDSGLAVTIASSPAGICSISGNLVTIVAAGGCQLTASQAGNDQYNAAGDVSHTVTIAKANQTITFADPADQAFVAGGTFTASASSTSKLAVTLASSTTGICTISGNTVTMVSAGVCQLTASQAGNTNFNAAAPVNNSVTIGKADQTITFADPADQAFVAGGTFTTPASSTSKLAVTLASSTTGICTVAGNTVTIVAAGDCLLTATQTGDTNFNAATPVNNSVTIGKADQTITFVKPANKPFVAGDSFAAPASSSSELAVTIASSSTEVCTVAGNTVTIVAAGDCLLTASQAGGTNFNPADDVNHTVGIGKADQTISFDALADKAFGDAAFAVSATGGESDNPVTFTAEGSCTVADSNVTLTTSGICTITAAQAGNDDFNAATDVPQSFNIADNDGVADTIENNAPNSGDGNNDGIPDSEQIDVTSLLNTAGDFITMEVSGDCSVNQNVAAVSPPVADPQDYTYPFGLLEFRLPCETATVKIYYHGIADLSGYDYRKYGPVPPNFDVAQWYTLDNVTFGSEIINGNQVATASFNLTDAGLGDDTGDDGVIVDQGGPGLPPATVPPVTPPPVIPGPVTPPPVIPTPVTPPPVIPTPVTPPPATSSPTAIPTLNPWMFALLSAMLGLIGALRKRGQ